MNTKKIKDIVVSNRQKGNTTWILKSAMKNPNCIIVTSNKTNSYELKSMYFAFLKAQPLYKKIIRRLIGKKNPIFKSIDDDLRGYNLPIIFDNSALI